MLQAKQNEKLPLQLTFADATHRPSRYKEDLHGVSFCTQLVEESSSPGCFQIRKTMLSTHPEITWSMVLPSRPPFIAPWLGWSLISRGGFSLSVFAHLKYLCQLSSKNMHTRANLHRLETNCIIGTKVTYYNPRFRKMLSLIMCISLLWHIK